MNIINFSIILGSLNLILLLEALVDAYIYLSWTKPENKWHGKLHHILQLVLFSVIFMFGGWVIYEHNAILTLRLLVDILVILSTYMLFRLSIFNILYNDFSGQSGFGKTDIWDQFCNYVLQKVEQVKYYKTIIFVFGILRIIMYLSGILILYLNS